jgi:hypothetical protein
MRLLSAILFSLSHVWQLPYKIVRVLMIKHYAICIESGICWMLVRRYGEDFGLIACYLTLRCWLDRLLFDIITLACPSLILILEMSLLSLHLCGFGLSQPSQLEAL